MNLNGFKFYPDYWLDLDKAVLCALGIMVDAMGGPIEADDVVKSVIIDLRKDVSNIEIYAILDLLNQQHLIMRRDNGYVLTAKGAEICDETLSKISVE